VPRNESGALAIRILALLAVHPDGLLSSDRLGNLLDANPVVLRRLIVRLKWDGLVATRRGPGGGCALARDPGSISLGRVHRALRDDAGAPPRSVLSRALADAEKAYVDELDLWTIAQLIEDSPESRRNNESYKSAEEEDPHLS
jgi:DNA-binding IscR family transcriptional regulator